MRGDSKLQCRISGERGEIEEIFYMEIWLLQILLINENSIESESVVWKPDCVICCFTIISEGNTNPGQPACLTSARANVVIEGKFLENKSKMHCNLSKR